MKMVTNHEPRQLLIDLPVIITDDKMNNTLCLTKRGSSTYVASHRFLVVLHYGVDNTIKTPKLGEVWIYSSHLLGTDKTMAGIVLEKNVGKTHMVMSLKERITSLTDYTSYIKKNREFDGKPIDLLSEVLRTSPRFDRPGGARGVRGGYRRGVRVGELWLTEEANTVLAASLGKNPGKGKRMKYLSKLILEAANGG